MTMPPMYRARLCKICKWDDYSGYGFSLHATTGKVGHFISEVDQRSPAYAGGIRDGDFVVEVNGVNVLSEPHQQVVERIKARSDQVILLVLDKQARKYFEEQHVVVASHMDSLERINCPPVNPYAHKNSLNAQEQQTQRSTRIEIIHASDSVSKKQAQTNRTRSSAVERDSLGDLQAREAIEQIEREVARVERVNGLSSRSSDADMIKQSEELTFVSNPSFAPNTILIEKLPRKPVDSTDATPSPKSRTTLLDASKPKVVNGAQNHAIEERPVSVAKSDASGDLSTLDSSRTSLDQSKDQALCDDLTMVKMRCTSRGRKNRNPSSTFTERKKIFDQL